MSDEVEYVNCPVCGSEQPDMGVGVECEDCGHSPMPYRRDGELIDEG